MVHVRLAIKTYVFCLINESSMLMSTFLVLLKKDLLIFFLKTKIGNESQPQKKKS